MQIEIFKVHGYKWSGTLIVVELKAPLFLSRGKSASADRGGFSRNLAENNNELERTAFPIIIGIGNILQII